MGLIRDIFLLQAIRDSGKKALASRDANGNAICGGCRTNVHEDATTCPNCTADLYTKRGKFGRRIGGLFGLSFVMMAAMGSNGPGVGLLGSLVLAPVGVALLFLAVQWYRKRPIREMDTREQFPF